MLRHSVRKRLSVDFLRYCVLSSGNSTSYFASLPGGENENNISLPRVGIESTTVALKVAQLHPCAKIKNSFFKICQICIIVKNKKNILFTLLKSTEWESIIELPVE